MPLFIIKTFTNKTPLFALDTDTFLDALQSAVKWRVNLNDANLARLDLAGADLRGGNFRDANFSSSNLTGANLRASNLQGTNLQYANFTDANIQYAVMFGARTQGAIFIGNPRPGAEPGPGLYRSYTPPSPYVAMTIAQFQAQLAAAGAPILSPLQLAALTLNLYPPNSLDANTMGIIFTKAGTPFTQRQAQAVGYFYPQPATAQLGYSGGLA